MRTQEENLKTYQWLINEQKAFCFRVNWMTSILAGFSVVNVGMPVGMPWEGENYD